MHATRFFEVAVPEMARRRAALFGTLSGTLTFIVRDVGEWTVYLGSSEPVQAHADPEADLVLSLTPPAFEGFLRGDLDLPEAMASHSVAHDGDLGVLTRFSRLLVQAQSPLTVQFGGAR